MAVYSVNQNRQLYVAKAYNASVSDASAVGTIGEVKVIGEGKDKELIFKYKGADNTLKSDYIKLENLNYVKAINAADMIEPLKSVKVALDSNVNGGSVVVGQDYILRINFQEWIGDGVLYPYTKDAAVHATAAMVTTPLLFYQEMVKSLNYSFARELGANKTSNPYLSFTAAADGITITEKEQGFALGTEKQERVYFDAQPTTVLVNGNDEIWGTVTDITPAKSAAVAGTTGIGNGKKIANIEWFCMGERGDQYRNMGWPNVITTQYLVDATKQYHVLEFHFAFTDEGVNSYRSEKDITIVADDKTVINSLVTAINTATGLNIDDLGE